MSCDCCKKNEENLAKILEKYENDKSNLIQILNEVQETYGYIPEFAQTGIANYLGIEKAEVYGVITFYSRFTLNPKGKYSVSVCMGTACFVKGAESILDKAKDMLKIKEGQTTEDGKFSIDATRCIGACGLAPVFTINEEVYGKATPEMIEKVIKEYQNK